MIRFLLRFVLTILGTSGALYGIAFYFHQELGIMLDPLSFSFANTQHLIGFAVLGLLFRGGMTILKPVLKFITFPIKFLTLGLSNILINVGLLYLLAYITQEIIDFTYVVTLGTFLQTLILSFILSLIMTIIDFITKKLF